MFEKIIPSLDSYKDEINKEHQENVIVQYGKTVERLINFPSDKMAELHLQDWYSVYWNLMNMFQYIGNAKAQMAEISTQLKPLVDSTKNPVSRQYLALAFMLIGDIQEFEKLVDLNLWSKNLREDFETFSKFYKLTDFNLELVVRSHLRRNAQIRKFLNYRYTDLVKKYANAAVDDKTIAPEDYKIYFCWLQGEENLPPLIRCCYNSLKQNAGNYEVVFINQKNYSDYVTLPEYITKKIEDGQISKAHFSDILEVNLLEQHGGLWIDATVLVTEPLENYKQFWKLPLYTQKFYQEKSNFCQFADNPSYGRWATFIIGAAVKHNPIFAFMRDFYNEYWKEFDEILDYCLMDFMIDMAYENIPAVKQEFDAVPINNNRAWDLLGLLNLPYNEYPYDKILAGNFFNKLNWKKEFDQKTPDTVLKEIQKRYATEN